MAARRLSEARIEGSVLGVLEAFDGVPLSVKDISDEAGWPLGRTQIALKRLWESYAIQRRREQVAGENPKFTYWIGLPKL